MGPEAWAIGVDLGGTKLAVAAVDAAGRIRRRLQKPTDVKGGPDRIVADIAWMARELREQEPDSDPVGVGRGRGRPDHRRHRGGAVFA